MLLIKSEYPQMQLLPPWTPAAELLFFHGGHIRILQIGTSGRMRPAQESTFSADSQRSRLTLLKRSCLIKKTPLEPVEHRALRDSCADRVCCKEHRPVGDEIGHKAEEQMGLWPDRTVAKPLTNGRM